ncbi:zinc knuckle, partial [Ostertagia ostertagi]
MATTLSTRQGLLTKALNRLNSALEANKDWAQAILQPPSDEHERRIYMRTERAQIRTVKAILEAETLSVDDALGRYSSAADSLAADTPSLEDILRKVNSNVETAVAVLDYGHTMLTALKRRLEELDEMETHTSFSEAPQTNLAPIPIPKFSGRIWEWDTFWGAFQHSVDSREIDDLYKMNYLLDALQGEAKETVKQFEVSGRTYPLVVAHLKEKYGNTQALVDHMIRRLQKARAQSERLEHQEKLLEELSSIVSQLQLKGENVDNCFLQDQLLGKFTEGIQRHVLRTKEQRSPNDNWDTNMLLSCAKEYIRTELKIVTRVGKRREQQPVQEPAGDRRYPRTGRKIASASERQHSCFYCGKGDHAAKDCTEVATREERMSFMRKRNLCLNCGSAEHWAGQCKGGACRICNNHGHHTSLCQQLPSATKKPSAAHESKKPHQTSNRATPKRPVQKSLNSSKMNTVVSEPQPSDEVPTTAAFVNLQRSIADVHILVGQAHVLNPKDQALEAIHVLLDTGADRSFICTELADRLQLRDISSTKLTINTFGSKQPLQQTCGITQVQMWDSYGKSHRITVTKIGTVTEPILRRSLSEEDRRFLRDNNICLSIHADIMELKPQVLLGCADLYAFLEGGFANQKTLPSGLTLIPSKLGYLVSGYETPPETHPVEQPHSDAGVKTSTTGSIEDEQDLGNSSAHLSRQGFAYLAMDKPKKTPSTTAETNTTATAPSVPGATPQSKPRVPPKRPPPAAKPAATAGKGRASGTMLKELLQQGSRILRLAACKVDQLAPAVTVTSSEESMQYLKRFEQLLQTHHVRSETAQKSIEAKIDTLMLKVDTITNRLDRVEQMMKGTATASALKEQSSVEQTRWRELQIEIQGLQAKVDALNLPQLQRDMDELKASLKELNSQNVVDVDSQPNAAREPSSEMKRVLRQMGETERELKEKPEEVVILAAPGETRTHAEDRRNDAVRQDRRTTSTDGPSEMPRTT